MSQPSACNIETLALRIAQEATQIAWENGAADGAEAESQAQFFIDDTEALRGMGGFDFLAGVSDRELIRAAARANILLGGR